jgi:hypothetical protein
MDAIVTPCLFCPSAAHFGLVSGSLPRLDQNVERVLTLTQDHTLLKF